MTQPTRPTLLLDGQARDAVSANILSLCVEESLSGPAQCEVTLNNWREGRRPGYLYFDRAVIDFGNSLQVRVGDASIFDGRISAIEAIYSGDAAPRLRVLAADRMQDLQMNCRTRTFEVGLTDIFRQIGSDHGLYPAVIDLPGLPLRCVAQLNESDLAFLTNLCQRFGLRMRVFGQTMEVRPDQCSGDPVTLVLGRSLQSFRVQADIAGQRTSLTVSGWDVDSKHTIEHRASEATIQSELAGQTSGATILNSALGPRAEFLCYQSSSSQEAQAMAEAAFGQRARRFVTGSGVALGNPDLSAGRVVDISGLGSMFSGRYCVAQVCHSIDTSGGYTTVFQARRAGIEQP